MKPGRKPKADSRFTDHAADLGRAVREARDKANLSRDDLAAQTGVSSSWIAKLERGDIIEPGLFPVLTVLRELGLSRRMGPMLNAVMGG